MLPDTLLAYVPDEPGAATRRLHDWRRARRPDRHRPLPVQFNTWYACDELPEETRLTALIPTAARLGCEVFVLDAGWYASRKGDPNDDWYMRAGDWIIDRRRLPSGFRRLREMCAQQGMALGIWCEPEAVGPRAQIRQTGASWLHHLDGKPPPPDGRAVLHLGVPEAWEHARRLLFDLIRDSGATWLKWDFNANLGAGGWAPDLPAALTDQDPLVAHYHGLYRLEDVLRGAFPDLVLEMCASGAGRMDGAILSHAHTHWLSDQPHAVAKLAIHFGMQQAHPAICCNDWLIDWPARSYHGVPGVDRRGDLMFRLHVAMLGSFGVSAPIDEWAEPDLAIAAGQIALYRNRLRTLIQNGDQYLLTEAPPFDGGGDWAAIWYLEKTGQSGALFTFRLEGTSERHFPLPGFKGGRWRIVGNGGVPVNNGIQVMLSEPYRSTVLVVEQT